MERIEALRTSVDQLSAQSRQIRAELKRRTWILGWLLAAGIVVLACAILAAYTVSLNNQAAIEKSNRQWCPMVGLLIPGPGEPHASTPRGKDLEENARALYITFGCGTPS
jgi:hypothetical protein